MWRSKWVRAFLSGRGKPAIARRMELLPLPEGPKMMVQGAVRSSWTSRWTGPSWQLTSSSWWARWVLAKVDAPVLAGVNNQ